MEKTEEQIAQEKRDRSLIWRGYVAGAIDNGSSVLLTRRKTVSSGMQTYEYYIRVRVSRSGRKLLDWLKETYGGCVVGKEGAYHYDVSHYKAEALLKAVGPWLINKGPILAKLKEFKTLETTEEKARIYDEIRNL